MKAYRCPALLMVYCLLLTSAANGQSDGRRIMVVTVDDLPFVSAGYPDTIARARRTTNQLLSTFVEHQVPVTGFVNESKVYIDNQADARIGLLTSWVESGAMLGNHTFSHADLNQLSIEEFQREIILGEPLMLRLMEPYAPYQRFFRYPQNHAGDTIDKKNVISAFLEENGYDIAPHTIDSQDWLFNRVYVIAVESDNQELAARIRDAYVNFVVAATEFAEVKAKEIFRQSIPQTLLIHANDLNADTLDRLLTKLERRGYEYASLAETMTHEAYRTSDTYITAAGPSWLWRWTNSLNLDVSFSGDPEPPAWILELFAEAL